MIQRRTARLAVITALALGVTTMGAAASGAADPGPASPGPQAKADKLNPLGHADLSRVRGKTFPSKRAAAATGRVSYFVRFKGDGAADAATRAGGGARGVNAAKSRRSAVNRLATNVLASARGADSDARSIYTVSNALPGAGMVLDAAGFQAVSANANVASVTPLVSKTARLKSVDSLVKAINVWRFAGNTGKGVTIGIVDTGVDYTHADFGGVGTVAGYEAAHAQQTSPAWVQNLPAKAKAKFAGGYDFAGDAYDASGDSGPDALIPHPDNNPLDCNGHGTHVAGIAAGYGVKNGKPVKAKLYKKMTSKRLEKLDLAPGMAPKAKIFALRVFGCEGATDLDIPAYDRALDPNGDGDFSDHLDIINASLGSDFGAQDDPSLQVVNELAQHGVLPAMSIGNSGDLTDAGGMPGSATASLASASSMDRLELFDQLRVNAPADVAGLKPGQFSVAYDWLRNGPTKAPVTGTVATLTQAGNEDGCAPLDAGDQARVAGKVAWLVWDDNDATRECGSVARAVNARNAGAIGAIFTSTLEEFPAGITGDTQIPVVQLTGSATSQLAPAAAAGTLSVTFDGSLQYSLEKSLPAQTDTVSDFSSRGPHGSLGQVKPDVTAPGQSMASANVGTGSRIQVQSGTSMASPVTAGIAALVKAAHPKWSPLKVKAAIMNTARQDLFTGPNRTGLKYGPARVGAGRIDAKAALNAKLLAWTEGPNNPVSASFGVVTAPINGPVVTRTKTVKVTNLDKKKAKVSAKYEALVSQPGVTYTVSPSKVTIKPKKSKRLTVTMTVTPSQLRHTIDPTMEVTQLGVARQFVSDASGRLLVKAKGRKANRVPVYGAAKPTSATTATRAGSTIAVAGSGFNTGAAPSDWRSLVSVTQLGATSPVLPACAAPTDDPIDCANTTTDRGSDIQYTGAGSNADHLWFAMSTHTDWTNLVLNSPDFLYDTDGILANGPEFETFVTQLTASDVYVAATVNLVTEEVDYQPLNFNFGDVDTNVFDNNVVVLPVDKAFIGLDSPGSHPIVYEGANYNVRISDYTDISAPVSYDAGTPALTTAQPLHLDQGGTTIPLTLTGPAQQALVLHLHGAPGQRVQVLAP